VLIFKNIFRGKKRKFQCPKESMAGVVIFKSISVLVGFVFWGVENKRNPNISPYGQRDGYD